MKKLVLISFLFSAVIAKAQIGFEEYYSEKQLLSILQKAKTPWDQLEANGILAKHYASMNKDSLARVYLDKVKSTVTKTNDVKLKARGIWWDNYFENDTIKVNRLIEWANKNNLVEEKITGYIELTRITIHINLTDAEQNALTAKKLWDEWKKDSVSKDSLKLEVLKQLAHVYVHKRDGVKAVNYLLPLQDYATQETNLSLKESALNGLSDMYYEWPGQYKKATEWMVKLYEFYKNLKDPNKILHGMYGLAFQYGNLNDTIQARHYYYEIEKLQDSIGVYGNAFVRGYDSRYYTGLIKLEEYVRLVENNFNNRYALTPLRKASIKLSLYSEAKKLDSVKHYLTLYKTLAGDSVLKKDPGYNYYLTGYYMDSKQYAKAIPLLIEMKQKSEKEANLTTIQSMCEYLAEAYAGIHDYKNAYEFLDQAYKFKDNLEKLSGKEEVSLLEMQKQQELQIAAFNEEKKLRAAEQSRISFRNKVGLYSLLAGLLIFVLIAGLLWRNSRQKQKANQVLQNTLSDLKTTQAQLVQSEKMASLGELTAGIAHEIQNPLNFVNNFSEVNSELIGEMKEELSKGNIEEAKTIANDIDENEQKIIFHGKRADAIVKGMLQHSRSSSGVKEPTNINALADEYLRLAYHGLRAKDKSFNATMKTDFDATIGNINIIPQDIGRVILNLITNAFYVVNEKKTLRQAQGDTYEPTVSVSTKKINGKVEIKVSDNGNGIPSKVLDKIFQPFFTTKPTGQGTGLGLSLSYDIVKAHGGELKVETREGEGSVFSIVLPTT